MAQSIGEKIKQARLEAGMTQAIAGAHLEPPVTPQMWNQWESGQRNPRWDTLERIAAVFGLTVRLLLEVGEKEVVIDGTSQDAMRRVASD